MVCRHLVGPGDITASVLQLQPQEISPPPTANLDRSNDRVYENVTGLVKAVIEMSSKIQPAPPEEYVPMVKVKPNPVPVGHVLRTVEATVPLRVRPSASEVVREGHTQGLR